MSLIVSLLSFGFCCEIEMTNRFNDVDNSDFDCDVDDFFGWEFFGVVLGNVIYIGIIYGYEIMVFGDCSWWEKFGFF